MFEFMMSLARDTTFFAWFPVCACIGFIARCVASAIRHELTLKHQAEMFKLTSEEASRLKILPPPARDDR